MEIVTVEAIPVNVPVTPLSEGGVAPYVTNHGAVSDMDRVLVRVETDEGVTGWGEMRAFLSPEATVSVIEDGIAPLVEGMSPFEVETLRRRVFVEYTNVEMFFAPVEIACWDLVGQDLGRPVYELLGGWTATNQAERRHREHTADHAASREVEFAYCLGIISPEESRAKAGQALSEGYSVLKTKAGRDWREDVARIEAMHDEVDGELEFRLDPNQGWTLEEAVRVGASLADAGIYLQYMEQPIRVDSHEALARLGQRARQPLGPNEDTYVAHNLRRLIERGAVDVAVLDMTPAGGIAGLRQQAAIAEDAGVSTTHHCAFDLGVRTAAILHAVHGIPGFNLPPDTVYYAWEDDVLADPFSVENARMTVPNEPGLGIEVDEEKVAEYRVA